VLDEHPSQALVAALMLAVAISEQLMLAIEEEGGGQLAATHACAVALRDAATAELRRQLPAAEEPT
jgi:hypothetical protein